MTKDCVKMCLDHLQENLRKYPHDKKSIWKCLAGVGKNHPWAVLPLVPTLLGIHPYFDVPEKDVEEPSYVSILILIFNAAKSCSTMVTMFDDKVIRHYHYLRDTLPLLVPKLSILGQETITPCAGSSSSNTLSTSEIVLSSPLDRTVSTSAVNSSNGPDGRLLLKELIGRLKQSQALTPVMQTRMNNLILKDLKVGLYGAVLFFGI